MLCGYSMNNKDSRIYDPATRKVVETGDVIFIETLPRTKPPPDCDIDYLKDVRDYTDFLNTRINRPYTDQPLP